MLARVAQDWCRPSFGIHARSASDGWRRTVSLPLRGFALCRVCALPLCRSAASAASAALRAPLARASCGMPLGRCVVCHDRDGLSRLAKCCWTCAITEEGLRRGAEPFCPCGRTDANGKRFRWRQGTGVCRTCADEARVAPGEGSSAAGLPPLEPGCLSFSARDGRLCEHCTLCDVPNADGLHAASEDHRSAMARAAGSAACTPTALPEAVARGLRSLAQETQMPRGGPGSGFYYDAAHVAPYRLLGK